MNPKFKTVTLMIASGIFTSAIAQDVSSVKLKYTTQNDNNIVSMNLKSGDDVIRSTVLSCENKTCLGEISGNLSSGLYEIDVIENYNNIGSQVTKLMPNSDGVSYNAININPELSGKDIVKDIQKASTLANQEVVKKLNKLTQTSSEKEMYISIFANYEKIGFGHKNTLINIYKDALNNNYSPGHVKNALASHASKPSLTIHKGSDVLQPFVSETMSPAYEFMHMYFPNQEKHLQSQNVAVASVIALGQKIFGAYTFLKGIFGPKPPSIQDVLDQIYILQDQVKEFRKEFNQFYTDYHEGRVVDQKQNILYMSDKSSNIMNQYKYMITDHNSIEEFIESFWFKENAFTEIKKIITNDRLLDLSSASQELGRVNSDSAIKVFSIQMKKYINQIYNGAGEQKDAIDLIGLFNQYNSLMLEMYTNAMEVQYAAFYLNATTIYLTTHYTGMKGELHPAEDIDPNLSYEDQMKKLVSIYKERIKGMNKVLEDSLASSTENNVSKGLPGYSEDVLKIMKKLKTSSTVPYLVYASADGLSAVYNPLDHELYDVTFNRLTYKAYYSVTGNRSPEYKREYLCAEGTKNNMNEYTKDEALSAENSYPTRFLDKNKIDERGDNLLSNPKKYLGFNVPVSSGFELSSYPDGYRFGYTWIDDRGLRGVIAVVDSPIMVYSSDLNDVTSKKDTKCPNFELDIDHMKMLEERITIQ